MQTATTTPEGELVMMTIAMPTDTNVYGDIFGGWLLSQMDLGGSVLAHQMAGNRVTTVAVDGMMFLKPVKVGDRLACYASIVHRGRTSIGLQIQAWVMRLDDGQQYQVTHGKFTYVSIDEHGKPKPIQWA